MGLISEIRTSLENPQTPLSFPAEWLLDIFNGGRTDSGIRVSELTALQASTVFACVMLKGGTIGSLDLRIFEKMINADGRASRRIAHDHDLWDLIHEEPNDEMSSFTMRLAVQAHRMLWGNGYIEIQRDGANRPVALWPRNPAKTKVRRSRQPLTINGELVKAGELFYATTEGQEMNPVDAEEAVNQDGHSPGERPIAAADMIHLPGLALDGRIGQDVIQLARNAVGLALATEKFGGKFFGNGAIGYGVFKVPGLMAPEDFDKFKQEVNEAWGGENVQRPLILEGGVEYTATSTKPNEGQFIESRNFQIAEICRYMGVPPHMVGVTEKTSRANVEQIGQEFLTFSLKADLVCYQQEFRRKLFPRATTGRNAGRKFGVMFDTWPLVTPAASDLRTFIQAMVQWGVWSPNDARERLQDNPIDSPAADETWMQINMAPADQLYTTPALPGAGGDESESGTGGQDKVQGNRQLMLVERIARSYSRLFADAFGRINARSGADLKAFRQVFLPVLIAIAEELERQACTLMNTTATPEALENSRFLAGYLETMHHRAQNESWSTANGAGDAICARELRRCIRAFAVEAWRSVATAAAKEQTTEVEQ